MLSAVTPRNLMKSSSVSHSEEFLFPHSWAISTILFDISVPISCALSMKVFCRVLASLPIIWVMVFASVGLLIFSTHFIVKSTMALSVLDRVSYQAPFLRASSLEFH